MFVLNKKIEEIDKLQKKLDSLRPFTSGELERLKEEFVVEYTYDSNAIEGSTLTLDETALLLKENITIGEKPMSDHLAAIGHKDAYYYVEGLVKSKEPLNEKQILDIHNLVLMDRPEDKGKYRVLPVQILGTNAKLTEPFMIKKHMEELLDWYHNTSLNLIEKITLMHLKFETIHPFIDGNGRTGRLILNLELMKNSLVPINIKNKDKRKYYDAFKVYNENNNYELMLDLICDYLIEEINRFIKIK
ncbi:MAG: Fic family protein [Bacilli bacterium]|nr:Fic family protein [Bacilli bacterium]